MMTTHERRRGSGRARGTVGFVRLGVAFALALISVAQAVAADPTSAGGAPCSITQVTGATAQSPVLTGFGAGPSVSATGARIVFRADTQASGTPPGGGFFL